MTAALEGGERSVARPGRTLPPGKTPYPFYRRLCGPQSRAGRAEKSRPHRNSIPDRPARSQSLYWAIRMYIYIYIYIYIYACMCILYIYIYICTYTHTCTYYVPLVYVCVWPNVRYLWLGPADIDKRLLLGQESWQFNDKNILFVSTVTMKHSLLLVLKYYESSTFILLLLKAAWLTLVFNLDLSFSKKLCVNIIFFFSRTRAPTNQFPWGCVILILTFLH